MSNTDSKILKEHPILLEVPELKIYKASEIFWNSIYKAKEIVTTWPEWKRNITIGKTSRLN